MAPGMAIRDQRGQRVPVARPEPFERVRWVTRFQQHPRPTPTFGAPWLLLILLLVFARAGGPSTAGAASNPASRFAVDVKETEHGLPQNSVIAMTQTRDGYLWLGTLNGLVRYDGFTFRVLDENNTPGLNSSRIVYLFEDSRRSLWIGTETAGIVVLRDGQIVSPPELALGGRERRLMAACEDGVGAVWLYNAHGEIWRYHDEKFTPFLLAEAITNSATRVMIAEAGGTVWVGTDRGQYAVGQFIDHAISDLLPVAREIPAGRLDYLLASRQGGYWRLANGVIERWSSTNRLAGTAIRYPWGATPVTTACEDRLGRLIVGTANAGVYWFDEQGAVTRLSTEEDLSNNFILSLVVDPEGTLWVGTDGGGLNRVKRRAFDLLAATHDFVVQSVAEDAVGGLWIASNNRSVSYWAEGQLQPAPGLPLTSDSTRCVFVDRDQQVYLGTRQRGLFQWQPSRKSFVRAPSGVPMHPRVNVIFQDAAGRMWFGTEGGLVQRDGDRWSLLTTAQGLSADVITALAEDPNNGLWIGTQGGGLNLLSDGKGAGAGQKGTVTVHRRRDGELPSDDVTALTVDGEGQLWVGTSSGLARLKGSRWTRITTREGLVSDSVAFLLDDGRDSLWIGSNKGLMQAAKKDLEDLAEGRTKFITSRVYKSVDGLPTAECSAGSQPAACRAHDGRLWFPTIKGLVAVRPEELHVNTNPPPVVIEAVVIEGEPTAAATLGAKVPASVVVPPRRERIEFHFTSLNLGASERRFRYRLVGHETEWTQVDNARFAHYTRLPPAHYQFVVTACNEDGIWNPTGAAIDVEVRPAYWQTWWFRATAAVVALGLIVAVVFYVSTQKLQRELAVLRQQEALEKERARIGRDIHDQLGASLTQLSLLGELVETDKESPADIEGHARQICQTSRETTRTLDEIVWTVNPSNDTLEGVVNYVCKYAQEYLAVAGLRYRLEIPPQLPDAAVAPEVRHNIFLAAKEAVTNIVRHAHASSAWLRLHLEPGRFTLELADDGRGLAGLDPQRAATRNGLTNMRRRMEDVGGAFSFAERPEGGTIVRLTAPLRPVKPSIDSAGKPG
jgi:ligand-binding sensor domain-containing protein/signal transduction histidine kinase